MTTTGRSMCATLGMPAFCGTRMEDDMGESIKARWRTNVDEYKGEEWPALLPAVPSIGHHVQSANGKMLQIVNITWCRGGVLEIELHRPVAMGWVHRG